MKKKPQMLCINNNPSIQMSTYIRPGETHIESCNFLKILGFVFSGKPTCEAQIDFLLEKYRTRLWSLRYLAEGGMSREDLVKFYVVNLRPVLEYTQVTYHKMLTVQQSGELERAQATALRIAFGNQIRSYTTLLEESGQERLKTRRENAFTKFAKKTLNHENFSSRWFPENREQIHDLRRQEKYFIERARTDKLKNSPIFQMRKFLNTIS